MKLLELSASYIDEELSFLLFYSHKITYLGCVMHRLELDCMRACYFRVSEFHNQFLLARIKYRKDEEPTAQIIAAMF